MQQLPVKADIGASSACRLAGQGAVYAGQSCRAARCNRNRTVHTPSPAPALLRARESHFPAMCMCVCAPLIAVPVTWFRVRCHRMHHSVVEWYMYIHTKGRANDRDGCLPRYLPGCFYQGTLVPKPKSGLISQLLGPE